MKKLLSGIIAILFATTGLNAQEKYGRTLNIGAGLGYYGYYYTAPALHINYEFDVVKNLTLAPFLTFSTHRGSRYWGPGNNFYKDYYFRETLIPIGVKGSYYFDELFEANEAWDFYFGASLGFAFRTVTWDAGYMGDKESYAYASPLFATLHIGTEYHLSEKIGLFLDLATGYTTFGLGIHF
jgi:hypothetical protein